MNEIIGNKGNSENWADIANNAFRDNEEKVINTSEVGTEVISEIIESYENSKKQIKNKRETLVNNFKKAGVEVSALVAIGLAVLGSAKSASSHERVVKPSHIEHKLTPEQIEAQKIAQSEETNIGSKEGGAAIIASGMDPDAGSIGNVPIEEAERNVYGVTGSQMAPENSQLNIGGEK